ncbi:MAG: TAXI family TRAP transporter solute-binding subunit [Dactylosporangium sp.]|nr:TAXI family TRAP transporter solute-binding subunit [Dactylosporangium sp.]NNJ60266.1 TAXI family TRAP transporter solute-binding subunit [Dactylosporangium sp.]
MGSFRVGRRTALTTALLAATAAACRNAEKQISGPIEIATGSPTAVYHRYGTAYGALIREALPRTRPTVMITAASGENIALLERGTAHIGFAQADIVSSASPGSIAALARLYDDCLHLVVRADDPIWSVADLRGRKVSIGEAGSGTEVTAGRLLSIAGQDSSGPAPMADVRVRRLGLNASTTALLERRIDAFFFSGGLPVAAIAQLRETLPLKLIDLQAYAMTMRQAFGDHYLERVIPISAYGMSPALGIGIPNYLVVATAMPRPTAHALTRVLFAGREHLAEAHPAGASLDRRSAISTPPLSLHPGAAQYYRSVKA